MPTTENSTFGTDTCQAVSAWDEPCDAPAARECAECGLSFCMAHYDDPDWHPCLASV
ncbi:MAG: hypothetical protein HYZ57_06285 [Acidobacteria bacterium]|nr:hypothetical protein [Acidobacteriota bacterium]